MPQKLQNPFNSLCFVAKRAARRPPKRHPERAQIWSISGSFGRAREARPEKKSHANDGMERPELIKSTELDKSTEKVIYSGTAGLELIN